MILWLSKHGTMRANDQRAELIHVYEDLLWVKFCGDGEHELIAKKHVVAIELTEGVLFRVDVK